MLYSCTCIMHDALQIKKKWKITKKEQSKARQGRLLLYKKLIVEHMADIEIKHKINVTKYDSIAIV